MVQCSFRDCDCCVIWAGGCTRYVWVRKSTVTRGHKRRAHLTIANAQSLKQGENALPSTGAPSVLVNGTVVVKDSKALKYVFQGQAIRAPLRNC